MNRPWRQKVCFEKTKQHKINEMQFGLISTSTSDVVMETSLVSPVDTKQFRKRYDIVPLLFTGERNGTISYRSNFWFIFPYRPISGPVLERTA